MFVLEWIVTSNRMSLEHSCRINKHSDLIMCQRLHWVRQELLYSLPMAALCFFRMLSSFGCCFSLSTSLAFQDCLQMSSIMVLMNFVVCNRSSLEPQIISAGMVPWGQWGLHTSPQHLTPDSFRLHVITKALIICIISCRHSPFRQHKTKDKHEIDRMTMTMVSI